MSGSGQDLSGKPFGAYTILSELARGGQGVVYHARHRESGTPVALKLLLDPTLASGLKRFQQEARILARLSHPHLLAVHDFGEENGITYLASEFLDGEDLGALVKTKGIPSFEWSAEILVRIAHALQHCHELGLVHRDLKPANVMIERGTERPVLVDFGLVKRDPDALELPSLDGRSLLSLSGSIKGTPEFMAPEQVNEKKFGGVGPRTDVYALGATLYYLLTGAPPFAADAAVVVMRKVTSKQPEHPTKKNPQAPPALAQLCMQCLAKAASDRPQSATAVAAALTEAAGLEEIQVRAPTRRDSDSARLPAHTPGKTNRIGPYKVLGKLGEGGMGLVLHGQAPDGGEVAIKLLLHATPKATARFTREARLQQALGAEEGFVPVLETGECERGPYVVMPLLSGGTLRSRLREQRLSDEATLDLIRALAAALARAHEKGIVHRDMKPENVLFDADGRPLIADLGLAKHFSRGVAGASRSVVLSVTGEVLGTYGYMPPEQMADSKKAGPQADVFSLGAILYECFTGMAPFSASTNLQMVGQVERGDWDAATLRAEAPSWVTPVVKRCLAGAPKKRYPDAGALLHALDTEGADERGRGLLLGAFLLLLVVGLGVAIWQSQTPDPNAVSTTVPPPSAPDPEPPPPEPDPEPHPPEPDPEATPPTPARDPEPAHGWPPRLRPLARTPHTHLEAIWGSHAGKHAALIVDVAISPDQTLALSGAMDGVKLWDLESGEEVRTLCRYPQRNAAEAVAFSNDGSLAVIGEWSGSVRVFKVETGVEIGSFHWSTEKVMDLKCFPKDDRVATVWSDGLLAVWSLGTREKVWSHQAHSPETDGGTVGVSLSSAGNLLLTGANPPKLWNAEGKLVKTLQRYEPPENKGVGEIALSPNARWGALAGNDGTLTLWDVETGKLLWTQEAIDPNNRGAYGCARSVLFSPDSKRIYSGAEDNLIRVWDPETGQELDPLRGHEGWIQGMDVSADGRRLVSGGNDLTVRLWDPLRGEQLWNRSGHTWAIRSLAITPDGSQAVTGGYFLWLWNAKTNKALAPLGQAGLLEFLAISADARFATGGSLRQDRVLVWDLMQGRPIAQLTKPEVGSIRDVAFLGSERIVAAVGSPDGGGLAVYDRSGQLSSLAPWRTPLNQVRVLGENRALTTSPPGLQVWDVAEGKTTAVVLAAESELGLLEVSADSGRALTSGNDGMLRLWSIPEERQLAGFFGHGAISSLALAPDGQLALSLTEGVVRLWQLPAGEEIDRLDLPPGESPQALAFAPDGRSFFVATDRGVVLRFALTGR